MNDIVQSALVEHKPHRLTSPNARRSISIATPLQEHLPESELLPNSGFESGHQYWIEIPAQGVITRYEELPEGITPHNGSYVAWFGGANNWNDKLYQDVTVPATASSAIFNLWYWVTTEESAVGYDNLNVQLVNPTDENQVYVGVFTRDAVPR
ncbi:MAG: hypothetical protein WAU95_05775, partial [Anaerolineae bacterium]